MADFLPAGLSISRLARSAAFAGTLLLTSSLHAQETSDPDVSQYRLDNGLTIILAPSKTSQSVALVTQYGVGSANEAPGRSGFAHLFEHLMFEGTKSVPDFEKALSGVGGDSNAFTQEDATTYYTTGPKEALPSFLRLDADRMANLANAVSQEDLDNQRQVVLNEMRQNYLDQPGGAARAQTETALYPAGHPYAHATIGSIADLDAAALDDVIAFHRTFYVPSNAYVAITGSFDSGKARELIQQTFGLVPKSETLPVVDAPEPKLKPQRLNFVDAVATPAVLYRWTGARGATRESVVNKMAARALSVGKGSFDDLLIIQQGVSSGAGASWQDRALSGIFTLTASAAQGVDAGKLEAAAQTAFDAIKAKGITEETLKIVRADFESGYASIPSNPVSFGIALAEGAKEGDAKAWRRELDWSKSVTAEEVTAALRSFNANDAQVSTVVPGARTTDYPPAIANSTGSSTSEKTAPRPEIIMPEFAMAKTSGAVFPTVETRKLKSGATLISYKIEDNAKIGISLLVKGGDIDAPVGLSDLGMSVTNRGAGDLSLPEMDSLYRSNGISLYGDSSRRYSLIHASAPRGKLSELSAQLADIILRPRFDPAEWSALVDAEVTDLESRRKQPDYQAGRKLIESLYPAGARESRQPDTAALKITKSSDAKALFLGRMRPDAATFHVASNLPVDEVAAELDKALSGWAASGAAGPFESGARPSVKEGRADAEVAGATQAAILAALPAPDGDAAERTAFDLAVDVLGGGLNSRLNAVLREEKGWSYGLSASADGEKGRNNSLLYISAAVQNNHAEDSIKEMRRIIAALATSPVTADEFEAVRRQARARYLGYFEDAPGTAMIAGYLAQAGFTIADLKQKADALDSVTLQEVNRQAAVIAQSPMALSVAGDRAAMK
jgi:zinc protease